MLTWLKNQANDALFIHPMYRPCLTNIHPLNANYLEHLSVMLTNSASTWYGIGLNSMKKKHENEFIVRTEWAMSVNADSRRNWRKKRNGYLQFQLPFSFLQVRKATTCTYSRRWSFSLCHNKLKFATGLYTICHQKGHILVFILSCFILNFVAIHGLDRTTFTWCRWFN